MIRVCRAIGLLALLSLCGGAWGQVSYNVLTSASNPDLIAGWHLQDDAASTDIANIKGGNATLTNAGNTSASTTAGPTAWLPKAITFDGTNDFISTGVASRSGADERTIIAWCKPSDTSNDRKWYGAGNGASPGEGFDLTCESGMRLRHGGGNRTWGSASTNWRHYAAVVPSGASSTSDVQGYINAELQTGSQTGGSAQTLNTSASDVYIGRMASSSAAYFQGAMAQVLVFSVGLSAGEIEEIYAGPEPHYTASASLGTDGSIDFGEWDAYSNGSVTYEWVVALVDGTVVDSGTGPGTADLSGVDGETMVYLLVRASNDGGYDVGDFGERTSGYGLANDGYYEVASVETEASGPPPNPIGRTRWPWWLRRSEITKPKHYAARIELLGDSICIAA